MFVPGDRVLLKAGDTWSNQTLALTGGGLFDHTTYDSVFASTFATQQALYAGNTVFSDMHTKALSDGISEPEATNLSNERVDARAMSDAQTAAMAAADASASTKWVTVTSYGAGADPVFDGTNVALYGIKCATSWAGALKVTHVTVKNYTTGGVSSGQVGAYIPGFLIQNCTLDHIDSGQGVGNGRGPTLPSSNYWAAVALNCSQLNYIAIQNVTVTNSDLGYLGGTQKYALLDTFNCSSMAYAGIAIFQYNDLSIINCTLDNIGIKGKTDGTVAIFVLYPTRVLAYNCTITNVKRPVGSGTPDGVPFDIDTGVINMVVDSCNIGGAVGNDGAMSLLDPNPVIGFGIPQVARSGLVYVNNTMFRNGLVATTTTPTVTRAPLVSPAEIVTFIGNTITRAAAAPTQKLFGQNTATGDTPVEPAWHFGPSNVVTN